MQDFETRPEPQQTPDPHPAYPMRNGMETAAIILGILALLSGLFFSISIPLAAIGLLLALLSKGSRLRTTVKAKVGIVICTISLIFTAAMTVSALYTVRDYFHTEEFKELFEDYYEYYYDSDIDEDEIEDFLEEFL